MDFESCMCLTLVPSWLSEGDHPCVDFNFIITITVSISYFITNGWS